MNITILIKLLEAHAKKPATPAKKDASRPIVFKQPVEIGRPQKLQISPGGGISGTNVKYGHGGTKTFQVTTPGTKLPPGVKTKTVLARVQPQGTRMQQHGLIKTNSQKK